MTDIIRFTEEDVQKVAQKQIHRRLSSCEMLAVRRRVEGGLLSAYGLRRLMHDTINEVTWKTRMDI